MKVNKWTVGLAAVGLVSLASVVSAEEATSPVMTAISSTQISGYVDVSAQWNPATGAGGPNFAFSGIGSSKVAAALQAFGLNLNSLPPEILAPVSGIAGTKRDGFNLNCVGLTIEKPIEEGDWSAGYKVDLAFGADAQLTGIASDNIRQAYVELRAPVGNGIDFKVGRFDSIVGYESTTSYKNPNFTRSYGYTITPSEHTGILASYQLADGVAVKAGVANTLDNMLFANERSLRAESCKTYMGSIALTAPDSWGFLSGSVLQLGAVTGQSLLATIPNVANNGNPANTTHYYAGATIATGVEGLKLGATYSFADNPLGNGTDSYAVAAYASFQATEKLGLHLRGEYLNTSLATTKGTKIVAGTATLQYDLWENVLSRVEFRMDHDASGGDNDPWNGKSNDYMLAANVVYKF